MHGLLARSRKNWTRLQIPERPRDIIHKRSSKVNKILKGHRSTFKVKGCGHQGGWMMSLFLRRFCVFRISPSFSLMPHGCTASRISRLNLFTSSSLVPFQFQFDGMRMLNGFSFPLNTHQPQTASVRYQLQTPQVKVQVRGMVNFSKRRGKKKSVKAVAKRFHRTGSGKLKYWPAGKVHNMLSKSRNHRRRLCKPRYASKIQLKTLNKMISGW